MLTYAISEDLLEVKQKENNEIKMCENLSFVLRKLGLPHASYTGLVVTHWELREGLLEDR